jgi:hypothetical protein
LRHGCNRPGHDACRDLEERRQALRDLLELLRIRAYRLEHVDQELVDDALIWTNARLLEELLSIPGVADAAVYAEPAKAALVQLEPEHADALRPQLEELAADIGIPLAFGELRRPAPVVISELDGGESAEVRRPGAPILVVPADQAREVAEWLGRLPDPAEVFGSSETRIRCVRLRRGSSYVLLRVVPCEVCGEERHHGMPHVRRRGSDLLGQCPGGTTPTFDQRLVAAMEVTP